MLSPRTLCRQRSPIVQRDTNDAHVVCVQNPMAETHTLPGSYHGSCTSDYLPEEVKVHGMLLAWVCRLLKAVSIVLFPQARKVGFDDVIQHDRQHLRLKSAIFSERRPSPTYSVHLF